MPTSSAVLRQEIEARLARRIPSALTPAHRRAADLLPCSDARLNALLGGGLPAGAVSEVYGAASSGRTTLAMSLLCAVTANGCAAAWIDVSDAFDPETAARCGVDLQRLLWVRCAPAAAPAEQTEPASPNGILAPSSPQHKPKPVGNGGCGSPHPRSEGKGMAEAIHSLLETQPRSAAQHGRRRARGIGTPGAPNRSVMAFPHASPYREEQTPTDRAPARRGHSSTEGEPSQKPAAQQKQAAPPLLPALKLPALKAKQRKTIQHKGGWDALDHALRVTDLLLQSGGFSLLVLDLAGTPAEMAWRIPLATWFRFRAACERSQATLLVLSQHACARTSADRIVHMQAKEWSVQGNHVVIGISFSAEVEKERHASAHTDKVVSFTRKPPQAESTSAWRVQAPWSAFA